MSEEKFTGSELTVADLFRWLWKTRAFALTGVLIAIALASISMIALQYSSPSSKTFKQEIAFRIGGQSETQYPNGTNFSPNDLRSPVVLRRVYEDAKLSEFGIEYQNFVAAISISPSSAIYEGVVGRYRQRLADDSLTFEERRQIEDEFSSALGSTLSSGATVNLTLVDSKVPDEVGIALVSAIPNIWADVFINQLGVLDLPVPNSSNEIVSAEFLDTLDYPAAYDALTTAYQTTRARIDQLKKLPGSQSLSDPETKQTLFDVELGINNLEQYSLVQILAPLTELGLNKSPALTTAAYEYQLQDLDRKIRLAGENARIVELALVSSTSATANTVAADQQPELGQVSGNIVQQFGPELVDRLIGMSVENAGIDFREALVQTRLDYEREALQLTSQREIVLKRLSLISGETPIENEQEYEKVFQEEAARLTGELNANWSILNRILSQINLERLNFDKELFQPLPTLGNISKSEQISVRTVITTIGLSSFVGLIGGLIWAYLLSVVGPRRG